MCELKQEKHGVESGQLQSNVLNGVRIKHIWDWDDLIASSSLELVLVWCWHDVPISYQDVAFQFARA